MMTTIRPPERIETDRLIVRLPKLEDAQTMFEIAYQDPEVVKYMYWQPHPNVKESLATMKRFLRQWETDAAYPMMIEYKQDQIPIGVVELRIEDYKAELGYMMARPYWGQGLMTEAARLLVDWAMGQPSIYRVWATCDVDNIGSVRVLEKVGMQREGVLRRYGLSRGVSEEPRDRYAYSIVK